jgi:formate/nitrite transporter FocA (FNT family)
MIFIIIGAEHCIADFPYLLFNLSPINILKFICIVIGNSLGAILIERLCK